MISQNLFEEVLVSPASGGASELLIVSGYASGSMAYRHLSTPEIAGAGVKTRLIVGMALDGGISLADHAMFRQIEKDHNFECHYRIARPSVHSKVYVWMSGDAPLTAFIGSANYTEQGFLSDRQENGMDETDPREAHAYFMDTLSGSMAISHDDIEDNVIPRQDEPRFGNPEDCLTVSLLARGGEVPRRSGLNWGQRPERRRNPNEAYIQLGAERARSGFFPPRPEQFTILTDDGLSIVAVRAQKSGDRGGDAIETPEGNHILGAYLRSRMGIPGGAPVAKRDLENYGRTDVTFCKIEDDTYYMDFSV